MRLLLKNFPGYSIINIWKGKVHLYEGKRRRGMRFADSFGLTDICASAGNYAAVGYALRWDMRCGGVCAAARCAPDII